MRDWQASPPAASSRWWWNERLEERRQTSPGAYIELSLAPWHWRILPWWFVDDLGHTGWIVAWLFLEIEYCGRAR